MGRRDGRQVVGPARGGGAEVLTAPHVDHPDRVAHLRLYQEPVAVHVAAERARGAGQLDLPQVSALEPVEHEERCGRARNVDPVARGRKEHGAGVAVYRDRARLGLVLGGIQHDGRVGCDRDQVTEKGGR